jgi:hypothetical protein
MTERPKNHYARRKAKAKQIVLHASFVGWEDDGPGELTARIHNLRSDVMFRHRFTEPEWQALDAMRDKPRTLQKFQQAIKEAPWQNSHYPKLKMAFARCAMSKPTSRPSAETAAEIGVPGTKSSLPLRTCCCGTRPNYAIN